MPFNSRSERNGQQAGPNALARLGAGGFSIGIEAPLDNDWTHAGEQARRQAGRLPYDGLSAHNCYSEDGSSIRYAIVSGPYAGASGEASCEWRQVGEGVYAISWQEADGSTVVHLDDFAQGLSLAYFTAADLRFHRMQGPLTELAAG